MIAKVIDKKRIATLLLIDFAKAFDRVSHRKLLLKLGEVFQFSHAATKLMHSYLTDRSQAVFCNDKLSRFESIVSGVPQGSVLGPLLFSLFINDLPSTLRYCSVHLFADDVQIYLCELEPSNYGSLGEKVNYDLQRILDWSQRNLLPINPAKTKAMLINRGRNIFECPNLVMDGENIEFVDRVESLGIIITSKLNWDDQISSQCGKIYGWLKRLNLVTRHFSIPIKLKLFKTLLLPHFIYGDFINLNASVASLDKLRLALNSCVRYVYNLSRFSRVSHLHKELIGCSFSNLYRYRSCITIFKILLLKKPEYLFTKLSPMRSDRNRSLLIPQHRSAYYSQSLFARGIVFWNQLPLNIKANVSIVNFKRDLKQLLAA